jgi:hypothetical protein
MTKTRLFAYILAALALIIITLPLTFPFGLLIPGVEKKVSDLLQTRVSISAMEIKFTPTPQLALKRMIIDTPEVAEIGEVLIPLNIYNILHLGKKLREVQTQDARISRSFAMSLPQRIHPDENGVRIQRLVMQQSTVMLDNRSVGPIDSVMNFDSTGQIADLTLADELGRVQLRVIPAGVGLFNLELSARGWELPTAYPAKFEYLSLRGQASLTGVEISDIRGEVYGGMVSGKAMLDWQNRWILSGEYSIKSAQAEPLIKLFSPVTYSTGRLSSNGNFRFDAEGYQDLFANPQIQGAITLMNGRIHNMDLVTPLRSQNPEMLRRGGQTEFNLLTGKFATSKNALQLSSLKLDGGKLRISGDLRLREQMISGSLYSQMTSGSMTIAAPLAISGKLDAPELRSSGAIRSRATLPDEVETPTLNATP